MWELDYDKQANYWIKKDADSVKLEPEKLKEKIESFITPTVYSNSCPLSQ